MSTHLTVTRSEQLTPALRRVWFESADLSAFADSEFTDRYVKLVFPKPGVTYPEPLNMRELRGTIPPEDLPTVRTYTALFPDLDAGTLAIDFVVHGDEGVAGPWAASAQPGDTLLVNGPGGAYRPDPDAGWHLLAGDEAAVPAITAALDEIGRLDADPVVHAFVLVESRDAEPPLKYAGPGGICFLHRAEGGDLVEAVRALEWPAGSVQAFVHGEADEVMHGIRPYLLKERGLDRSQVSISGYWRRGATEEGFRTWKHELAEAEGTR